MKRYLDEKRGTLISDAKKTGREIAEDAKRRKDRVRKDN